MLATKHQAEAFVNLFHQGTKLYFDKGEFIICPGDSPQGLFYIVDGLVKAYDITKFGEENLLVIRRPGEVFCLSWALTGGNNGIIYSALAPTTLMQISRTEFNDYIQRNPHTALPLIDMMIDMYRHHSHRVLTLGYRTVRERLISFLLTTAERFGKEAKNGLIISIPLRHQDIANSISATRETTGRELSALEKLGLLENKQSMITLKDIPKLRSYLE